MVLILLQPSFMTSPSDFWVEHGPKTGSSKGLFALVESYDI